MPVNLVRDCPHCGVTGIAMRPIGMVSTGELTSTAAFACNRCNEVLCVSFLHPRSNSAWVTSLPYGDFDATAANMNSTIVSEYPQKERLEAPESISITVQKPFLQGLDNAQRGNHDAAAAMFRKALEAATRELDPTTANKPLAKRIDLLADSGKLTADLKEWAHLIRLDGNQGVHDDEELSSAEIEQLKEFTRLFLIYTFTLPAQVRARKEAAAQS